MKCCHCGTPGPSPCPSCLELLSDLGEEPEELQPQPAPAVTHRGGPFEPTQADIEAYETMSERGSFRPFTDVRPKQLPSHARNKWGRAISNWKNAGYPDVPKK